MSKLIARLLSATRTRARIVPGSGGPYLWDQIPERFDQIPRLFDQF